MRHLNVKWQEGVELCFGRQVLTHHALDGALHHRGVLLPKALLAGDVHHNLDEHLEEFIHVLLNLLTEFHVGNLLYKLNINCKISMSEICGALAILTGLSASNSSPTSMVGVRRVTTLASP